MEMHSKAQRSYNMSRIRSKWTKPEKELHNLLKGLKIKHKMHPAIAGSPDIIFKDFKIALFIHGCFWHMCRKCCRPPKTNKKYWIPKLMSNVRRDKKNIQLLRKDGWKTSVLWEHDAKKFSEKLRRILA